MNSRLRRTPPEVIYYVAASLDGRIATPDGGVRWLEPFEQSGEDYGYARFVRSIDGLLFGRRTFEQVLTFGPWPYAGKACWVFSGGRRPASVPENVRYTKMSPKAVLTKLGALGLRRLWLVGGGELAAAFHKAGLITEYFITYVPVVLGDGVELLAGGGPERPLRIVGRRAFPSGVVQVRSVPAPAPRRHR